MKLPKWIKWSKTEGKYKLINNDVIPTYTDEEFQKFYDFSNISEEDYKKIEKIIELVGVPTEPMIDKVYGESMLSEFKNTSIYLPCGCPVESVALWTEAMFHIIKPENCPTLNKKSTPK